MKVKLHIVAVATLTSTLTGCAQAAPNPQADAETTVNQIFSAHDRNSDSCLSQEEWRLMATPTIEALRREHPDNLADAEITILHQFAIIDADHDGCLTREEYLADARRNTKI